MKNVLLKDTGKEIKNTFKRFLSILLVVLLGVGFFAGIKAASPDMKLSIDQYLDHQNTMDIEVLSTLGLTKEDVDTLKDVEGVENIIGTYCQDVIVSMNEEDAVIKMETLSEEINQLFLVEGNLPKEKDECVVEPSFLLWTGNKIGDTIQIKAEKIKDDEGNEKELLKQNTMKIVGTVRSPLYVSRERGNSKLGAGRVNYYMYIMPEAVTADIYTNVYIQVKGAKELKCYEKEYEDLVDSVKDRIVEISDSRKQARYDEIYDKANAKIQDAQSTLKKEKAKAEKEIKDAEKKIANGKSQIQKGRNEIKENRKKADTEFAKEEEQLIAAEKTLNSKEESFQTKKEETEKQIQAGKLQIELLKAQGAPEAVIQQLEAEISKAEAELKSGEEQISKAKLEIVKQKKKLETQKKDTYAKLTTAENKLNQAEKEITKNEAKLKDAKKEADEKIADAEEKLEEAKGKLDDIKKPEWYILDRNQNIGYANYIQDSDRVANIATVFPVVFFVVAALISLTSMSRMVEEERVQIGTLKALGYTKLQIASKYIIYATLATLIGGGIGLAIGFHFLPKIIMDMYGMMYVLPEQVLEFNIGYTIISMTVAMICTVGATIYSCSKALTLNPATLMRPKSPKPGKRVILEKIPLVWSHLSFTRKVTARNIFRYKKRFLMTIIGVMGCTALILAGFGLRDSISQMIPAQYGEIFKYDAQISLKDGITTKETKKVLDKINAMDEVKETLKVNMQAIEITSTENTQNIQLMIPENTEVLEKFITLRPRNNKEERYQLNDEGIIITEKLAKLLNIKQGDKITIKNSDDAQAEVKVSHITENYLMHYMYMSPERYEQIYGEKAKTNTILVNLQEGANREEVGSKALKDNEDISSIVFTASTENMFAEIMDNLNLVVWILIISAGLLAFVVLYNLSNTNISERVRELATIKVLGFYDKEVYDYVSKETTILTIIGMAIGLAAGFFLTMFIVNTCELDILMFDKRVNFISYIYAIAITVVFSTIVNIATYFALKKINMIESLKSVE